MKITDISEEIIIENAENFNFGPIPNERQLEWYERGLMAFIHFGMNTFTDMEWGEGDADPDLFCPSELDCRQWVKNLKEAGFSSIILTAKHHDGFCLWQSEYTDYSVKSSKWRGGKGDVVKEFTDACREFGVKAGIYLSPWDRHEKTYGTKAYTEYYNNQLKELLTNYGEIWDIWWDGAGSANATYDWAKWERTVHSLQPQAVIFGAMGAADLVDVRWVGNEKGIAGLPCWANVDVDSIYFERTDELNTGKFDGEKFVPAEADVSIRPGWFYHKHQDEFVKTPDELISLWFSSIGRNAGLLLNFPPDRRGKIYEKDLEYAAAFHDFIKNAFSKNLLTEGEIKASSSLNGEYEPQFILDPDSGSFFAFDKGDRSPSLYIDLGKETEFNTVRIMEEIKYGHHIKGFSLSALCENEWILLTEGECIGNNFCGKFAAVKARKLKLEINSFEALPLIRFMGIYNMTQKSDEKAIAFKEDILKNPSAKIIQDKNSIEVNLGGIYPFNLIRFESAGLISYELWIFNGTELQLYKKDLIKSDKEEIKLSEIIDHSYRFLLKFTSSDSCESINRSIEVYLL